MIANITRALLVHTRRAGLRSYHGHNIPKPATYDEIPVPMNSWKAHYDNNQKKYNAVLAAGIIFFTGSVGIVHAKNLLNQHVWFAPVPPSKD